jgi:UDP-glucose 4-epimerase
VADFAHSASDVEVCVLRFANGLGGGMRTAYTRLLRLPAVPAILGFDPRWQFIDEDDIVGLLAHAARSDMEGVFNAAADGVLALSEIADLVGKPLAPLLPPWGTATAAAALRPLGIDIPPELLQHLRYGRGLDNRKLKASGYRLRYTTREAAIRMGQALRQEAIRRTSAKEPYRYEREVEDFLRYSPSVRTTNRREPKLQNAPRGEARRELPESTR